MAVNSNIFGTLCEIYKDYMENRNLFYDLI